jgi:hypothetical protein
VPISIRKLVVPVVATAMCVGVGLATRQPAQRGAAQAAARFGFAPADLDSAPATVRTLRPVQPSLRHIAAWISAVGASVGLADLDGDGLPNDRCLVDPRDDSVTLAAVPGGPARYAPVRLLLKTAAPTAARPGTVAPMGCLPADLNADGWTDVVVYFWGRPPIMYLRHPGAAPSTAAWTGVDVTDPAQIWNSTTANAVDLDGDGHLDLVVGNYFPDGARVLDPAAAEDNAMQMQDSMSLASNGGTNRLLRFTGLTAVPGGPAVPRYADESAALTRNISRGWTLATGAQDLDGDDLPELYLANDFGPDHLLLNRSTPGHIELREVTGGRDPQTPKSKVLGHDSFKGMGVAFDDLNSDGRTDILVSDITTQYALHESNLAFLNTGKGFAAGRAPFRDGSEGLGLSRTGWAWDVKTGDFDADGTSEIVQALGFLDGTDNRWAELQELAMANDGLLRHPWAWPNFTAGADLSGHQQNPFFVRGSDGRFVDVSERLDFANPGASRALAVGDVDHDGRLDLAVANQWADSRLFRNVGPEGTYLGLRLVHPVAGQAGATTPAIGATVEVTRADGTRVSRQLYPGNGHTGGDAPEIYIGLGHTGAAPVAVTVHWRDATGRHSMTAALTPGWHTVTLPS